MGSGFAIKWYMSERVTLKFFVVDDNATYSSWYDSIVHSGPFNFVQKPAKGLDRMRPQLNHHHHYYSFQLELIQSLSTIDYFLLG